jgi:Family of unknown function (DUF6130)
MKQETWASANIGVEIDPQSDKPLSSHPSWPQGPGALDVSPRIGHLHISVDDLPWLWADASDNNTVDIVGLPPGEHKVKIALVDANYNDFPGQVVTMNFIVPEHDKKH